MHASREKFSGKAEEVARHAQTHVAQVPKKLGTRQIKKGLAVFHRVVEVAQARLEPDARQQRQPESSDFGNAC